MPEESVKYLQQQLLDHKDYCERRFEEGSAKMDRMIECTTNNSESVGKLAAEMEELTENVAKLTANTSGMIQIYQDVQGAARLGNMVKKAVLWTIGIPVVGSGFLNLYQWIIEYIKPGGGIT